MADAGDEEASMTKRDRELGLGRAIARRDFLNGVALGAAGALVAPRWSWGEVPRPDYPPGLTGLRGSDDGAFEAAHALKDGTLWPQAGEPRDTGEAYDLVVVGAGLSGLAAAHFFRAQAGSRARLLILDNHDDFGGHARRNEFRLGGRTFLSYGGTFAIESPAPYSAVAQGLVRELGVDVSRWGAVLDQDLYARLGMGRGVFFDRETFGADRLLRAPALDRDEGGDASAGAWRAFLDEAPLHAQARADLLRLRLEERDYLPGLDSPAKKARLARMSYADFLTGPAGCHAEVLRFLQARPHSLYGVGIDAVPAQDAWGLGYPGFDGMGLDPEPGPGMNLDAVPHPGEPPYFFHFPDGNATLARLLVRRLVPRAIPGRTAEDVVTARADYSRLDEPGAPARLRLRSTVVRVRHAGAPAAARAVEVAYLRGGRLESVTARRCVLACWHTMIPHLCPELPAAQREALAYAVKVPLLYTSVLLRGFKAFVKAGVHQVHAPGGYHTGVNLNLPVSVGGHRASRDPAEPVLVHMTRTPCFPGLSAREQHRAGRVELLGASFEEIERRIREQLARMLGGAGLDPARDVAAITVNRWPHGYAYQYNSLWDPFWLGNDETPCAVARRPFGRIAIANSDAAAYAYTDAAIDEAYRAVQELMLRRG
jgi:spermidine dehydrogenase